MKHFTFILFSFLVFSLSAQEQIDWVTLADVSFEKVMDESILLEYDKATFGETLKKYENKEVQLSGYVIPLDAMGINFVLSRNPNATCFFCGGGGPETVVDIKVKPSAMKRYKMDERRTFKGILKMYPDNQKQFIYVLTEAEPSS